MTLAMILGASYKDGNSSPETRSSKKKCKGETYDRLQQFTSICTPLPIYWKTNQDERLTLTTPPY